MWELSSPVAVYDAVVARLTGEVSPRVHVFGEQPPDATSRDVPYLIVDPDPGWDRVTRGDGRVSSRSSRVSVRCCGSSYRQALLALEACRDALRDWRPWPDDARYGALVEVDAGPVIRDDSVVTDPRFSFTLVFELSD